MVMDPPEIFFQTILSREISMHVDASIILEVRLHIRYSPSSSFNNWRLWLSA